MDIQFGRTPINSRPPFASTPRPPRDFNRDRNREPIKQDSEGLRINQAINAKQIRLIDAEGEMQGVVGIREALMAAEQAGLDLVEISPNAEPPVCKILDYGKYRYEQQKKAHEAKRKQKIVELKELKLRPNIGDNDYQVKMRQMKEFLEEGNKVKLTLRFRGREMSHQELGMALLQRIKSEMDALCKVELEPRLEGRQMIMVTAPK